MRKYRLKKDNKIESISIPEDHQINRDVERKIRERYSISDEFKARRTGGSFAAEVDAYIDDCVSWGREQKATAKADRGAFAVQLDQLEIGEIELMALTEADLITYANRIGFKITAGTRQEITNKILIAAGLK